MGPLVPLWLDQPGGDARGAGVRAARAGPRADAVSGCARGLAGAARRAARAAHRRAAARARRRSTRVDQPTPRARGPDAGDRPRAADRPGAVPGRAVVESHAHGAAGRRLGRHGAGDRRGRLHLAVDHGPGRAPGALRLGRDARAAHAVDDVSDVLRDARRRHGAGAGTARDLPGDAAQRGRSAVAPGRERAVLRAPRGGPLPRAPRAAGDRRPARARRAAVAATRCRGRDGARHRRRRERHRGRGRRRRGDADPLQPRRQRVQVRGRATSPPPSRSRPRWSTTRSHSP